MKANDQKFVGIVDSNNTGRTFSKSVGFRRSFTPVFSNDVTDENAW